MNNDLNATMADALQLTRDGRLTEATALLQQGLGVASRAGQPRAVPTGILPTGMLPAGMLPAGILRSRREASPSGLPSAGGLLDTLRARLLGARLPTELPVGLSGSSPSSAAAAASARAPGGEIRHLTYVDAAGSRTYDLYIPTGYAGEPVPLVIMLHGGTQGAKDFAAGTRMNDLAEQHTFLVAYPEQSPAANNGRYWNWFRPQDQRRDDGEPAILAGITRQIISDYAVDKARVYIIGFSAGGAMAAVMAAAYPDLYAAAGIHSGLAPGAAQDLPSAFEAMRNGGRAGSIIEMPLIVFHGDRDNIVAPINAERLIASRIAASSRLDGHSGPRMTATTKAEDSSSRSHSRRTYRDVAGSVVAEQWIVHGGSHAWSGGSPVGSYTDARGPDASAEMLRFFVEQTDKSLRAEEARGT